MNLHDLNQAILDAADAWASIVPFGSEEAASAASVTLINLINQKRILLAAKEGK